MDKFRMTLSLTKKQINFLDNILRSCGHRKGKRLGRAAIIRALLSIAKELKIDVAGVKSEKQLKNRITKVFNKSR